MCGLWWWESLTSAPETTFCYFCSCLKCKCVMSSVSVIMSSASVSTPPKSHCAWAAGVTLSLSHFLPTLPVVPIAFSFLFQAQVNGFTGVQQHGQLTHSLHLRAPFPCHHCLEGTLAACATPRCWAHTCVPPPAAPSLGQEFH